MQADFNKALAGLIRNGICGKSTDVCTDIDLESVLKIAKRHHISYIIYTGAVLSGFDKKLPVMKKLFIAANAEMLRSELQSAEILAVCSALEDAGADYMLLKGSILKSMYPAPEMRVMGDADILIRCKQYEKIQAAIRELGFTEVLESNHEYIWKKEGLVLELHKMLIPSYNKDYYDYFGDGWLRAIRKCEPGFEYTLSPEDMFIYIFTHFAKHYRDGGIGIKHLADIYVYLEAHKSLDTVYIEKELKSLSLYEFYKNILKTVGVWFNGDKPSPLTDHITEIIISSGAFGTHKAHVYAQALRASLAAENAGRAMLLQKAFPALPVMKIKYKYLEKAPVLLPFAWCTRIVHALIHKRKNIKVHAQDIKGVTPDDIADYENALRYVGLNFEKREQSE